VYELLAQNQKSVAKPKLVQMFPRAVATGVLIFRLKFQRSKLV